MRRDPPVLVLAALLTAACSGAASSGPTITVTDSAGIEIVTNPGDDSGLPVWRVDTVPLLSIGLVDGDAPDLLDRVGHATMLDDGRIAIANRGTDEVRLFDAEGQWIRSFGGDGDGPGEYRNIGSIHQLGDSLVVTDPRSNRITIQPLDGSATRTIPGERDQRFGAESWLAGRAVVLSVEQGGPPTPDQSTDLTIRYLRMPLEDGSIDTIVSLPNGKRIMQISDVGGVNTSMIGSRLFESHAHAATLNGMLIAGNGQLPELAVFGASGLERLVRWDLPGIVVLERHVDDLIDAWRSEDATPTSEAMAQLLERERVDSFPRFDDLLAGGSQLWVRRYRLPADEGPRRWWIHDADGRLIAVAEVPDGLTLYEVTPDRVLALMTDELDVQHVVLLPVREVQ
jgi:hypothetical protein